MPTIDQALIYCESVIVSALKEDVSRYLVLIFQEMYQRTVYDKEPVVYDRTYAAINAVESIINKTGNGYLINLFSNPKNMRYSYPSWFPNYPQDNREDIIEWLNSGTNSPYYAHPAHNFIGMTEDIIAKKLNAFFIKSLKLRGLKAHALRGGNS